MIPGQTSAIEGTDDTTGVRTLTVLPGLTHSHTQRSPHEADLEVAIDADESVEPAEDESSDDATDFEALKVQFSVPSQRDTESDPFGYERWDVKRRSEFIEQLDDRLRLGEQVAMVAIGLDRFHDLNMAEGRETGDAAIRNAHRVLRWMLGPGNVAYFGSDCFAAVLPSDGVSAEYRLDSALDQLAGTDLSDDLTAVYATASAGMVVVEDPDITVDIVLCEAERLLLSAKDLGGNISVVESMSALSAQTKIA